MRYICGDCQRTYPMDSHSYRCQCGGLFRLEYDKKRLSFDSLHENSFDRSLWRYREAMPPLSATSIARTTMGEGGTPLVSIDRSELGKVEYMMPTLSFKDRGAVVLVAAMEQFGIKTCAIDSSGNAGTAVAAYCARVGIGCEVFVPSHTSDKKIAQIHAHGAVVHKIAGTREDTANAALAHVDSTGSFYASHIFNPLFWEGTKTYIYELFEQMGRKLPDALVIPVGNGTLLMGVGIALMELKEWGYVDTFPSVIAVQAANCAPLAVAGMAGSDAVRQIPTSPTIAEGIASAAPARGKEILAMMKQMGGRFVTVSEQSIIAAQEMLAKRGLFVESTSAANHAGYLEALKKGFVTPDTQVVVPLCGAGLKSVH